LFFPSFLFFLLLPKEEEDEEECCQVVDQMEKSLDEMMNLRLAQISKCFFAMS
jgi:hypothetical protein